MVGLLTMLGFWYPYRNIFNLVDELGLKPFTGWTKSGQYSEEGLEVSPRLIGFSQSRFQEFDTSNVETIA